MKSTLQDRLLTEFEIYEKLQREKGSDVFLHKKEAIEHFRSKGWPTVKDELWKYTPVNFLNKFDFKLLNSGEYGKIAQEEVDKCLIPGLDAYKVVIVNGFFDPVHSDTGGDELGFAIHSTKKYLVENQDSSLNSSTPDYSQHAFAAVNTALGQDGYIISIAKNREIDKPIHVINIMDTDEEPVYAQSKNFVILGENAKATVLESFKTLGYNESLISTVTKCETAQGADLRFYRVQDDFDRSYAVNLIETDCHRDSKFMQMNVTLGGRFIRNDVRVRLLGENAYPSLEGVFVSKKDMLVDNHTFLDHAVPNCPSNELYRAVLDDKSRGVFNGKILVRQDAQKTNAYQSSKSVLLSDSAVMNSKPELEIYADDVKCSHGASTGSIDEDSLFYLRARGIPESKAKALLLNAFVHEITNRIEIEELKDYVNNKVDKLFHLG